MSMGQQQQQGPELAAVQVQRQRTALAQRELVEVDLADQLDDDSGAGETEESQPEPPRLEDEGDSDWYFTDKPLFDPFPSGPHRLRTIAEIPYEARPLVRYWIDHEFCVHKLDHKRQSRLRRSEKAADNEPSREEPQNQESVATNQTDDLQSKRRDLIARAVALHLRQEKCKLHEPSDWCNIPRIDGDQGLLNLVHKVEPIQGDFGLRRVGKALKSFAIMLPNGDVIAVQALLDDARKKKRATRAAALRTAKSQPFELAGDLWSVNDWRRFEINQRQAQTDEEQHEGDSP